MWKGIYTVLEQVEPEGRKAFAFALCMPAHLIWGLFHDVRKKHFGDSPLSNDEFFWTLGTALRGLGEILCTGEIESPTKGRVNVELLDLIKVIQQHERKRLKYAELVEVLAFAHFHVPDEAWLRLFVHRARKKRWIR